MYKCTICLKNFQKPSQLMRHIRVHTGEKPFKVNALSAYSINKLFERMIVSHISIHLCSVPFATGHSRKRVRYKSTRGNTTVSGRTPAASATPSLVRKVQEFAINILYINILYPSRWSLIPLLFNFSGNLKAHILRVHNAPEGEPTYACSYCSCIFKKLGSLNGHIKRVHSNPEEVISVIFACFTLRWFGSRK